jgi:cyclopropane fatty-acyl-phospholipid synthase-like methyltransferase
LDFGAGQGSLGRYVQENAVDVQVKWTDYDPGVQGKDEYPEEPFDLVVSSDVLEHIEPDFLEGTLAELRVLARKAQFHHIACDPSKGRLPDGRDMHLITEKLDWWLPRFEHPEWSVMYTAQCAVRKRGELRNHCHIQLDRV